ncbi:MAG: hypothetical protein KC613_17770, partial [Myxococcales bacterium]|nr:hypothetical protein [Myxococcales bacterium]
MRWPLIGLLCLSLVACDDGEPSGSQLSPDLSLSADGAPPAPDGAPADQGSAPEDCGCADQAVPPDQAVAPDQAPPDGGPAPDQGPVDPCALVDEPAVHAVALPLGETLFFEGDDYLVPFDDGFDCPITVEGPGGAAATPIDGRLTPDVAGPWVLRRGGVRVELDVQADFLNADTFVNYNYTPATALAPLGADELLVVAPPSNALQRVRLTGEGAEAGALIPTGGWPTGVAVWGEQALVTQTARDSLGFVDLANDRVVDAVRVGDEPAGIVVAGDTAFVTLSGEDKVARVDLPSKTVTGTLPTGRDPRALALSPDGATLYVLSLNSSNTHRFGPSVEAETEALFRQDLTVIDVAGWTVREVVPDLGTILRGLWAAPDGRVVVGVSHSRNQVRAVDAEADPHRHALAVVTWDADGAAQVRRVNLDRELPAPSPFSLVPSPDGSLLGVTLSAGKAILWLDPESFAEVGRSLTGNDPRGLVFAQGRAWTTAWLDNRVEGHVWPPQLGAQPVIVPIGRDPTPPDVKAGQRIFNDATFSRYGKFSCNNCHIDGLTDGLVWDLLVDGEVNTLAFRNVAGTDPFLWGGQLPTLFDFSREVLRLV